MQIIILISYDILFYGGKWYDVDGIDYSSVPKDKGEAVKFASSLRGQWIIGMALNIAIGVLEKEGDATDWNDMMYLQDKLFPLYKRVKEGGGHNGRRRFRED